MMPPNRKSHCIAVQVPSVAASNALSDPFKNGQVRHVVEMVALRCSVHTSAGNDWIDAVMAKLTNMGIVTLRDLVSLA
jgi:hypothetical protein